MAYLIFQPLFIDGAQLFQQHYGIFIHIVAAGIQFNMRRQLRLVHLCGDCSSDHGGTVFVPHIVLDDQHRPDAALLRADDRSQICVIDISSSHFYSFISDLT